MSRRDYYPGYAESPRLTRAPRLTRDVGDAYLGGVCAGLADHFRIDPAFVRIVAVAGLLTMTKLVVLSYLIAWAVIPRRRTYW